LSPGHPVFFSALHYWIFHGIDVHAVLESLFCESTPPPPAPLGPVVITGCQAQGNDDYSADYRHGDHRGPPSSTAVIHDNAFLAAMLQT
jgi:hypothetical protein